MHRFIRIVNTDFWNTLLIKLNMFHYHVAAQCINTWTVSPWKASLNINIRLWQKSIDLSRDSNHGSLVIRTSALPTELPSLHNSVIQILVFLLTTPASMVSSYVSPWGRVACCGGAGGYMYICLLHEFPSWDTILVGKGPITSRVTNMTEMYRPEPGLEPRVSRYPYERSTDWATKPTQFCSLNFRVLIYYPS